MPMTPKNLQHTASRLDHSWNYSDAYEKLIKLLDNNWYFSYKNYSVPKDDPIHHAKNKKDLERAIEAQIRPASCVLILAGVYASYSKWINIEIDLAKRLNKKIIAIEPWGAERTSSVVKEAADVIVKWNSASVIQAIEELCR